MKLFGASLLIAATFLLQIGEGNQALPAKLEGVGIDDKTGSSINREISLMDERGVSSPISKYFEAGLPVVFTVAYFSCPMLCSMVHKGLVDSINQSGMTVGKDFHLLTLSMDPRDTPHGALKYQERYESLLEKKTLGEHWPFLTGKEDSIRRVTDSVGFKFRYDKQLNEYLHQAGVFVLSPSGKITRVLTGIAWKPFDLKMAVIEAKNDSPKSGLVSTAEHVLLYCYSYNPSKEGYALKAMNLMRIAGGLTVLSILILVLFLKRRESHV